MNERIRTFMEGYFDITVDSHGREECTADFINVQKFADRDPTVWSWLRRARRAQVQGTPREGLDRFLAQMDLGEVGPEGAFDPRRDDLGEWFSGAPGWLRRS